MVQSPPQKVQTVDRNGGVLKKTIKARASANELKDTLTQVKAMAADMVQQSKAHSSEAQEEHARQAERDRQKAEQRGRDAEAAATCYLSISDGNAAATDWWRWCQ